MADGENALGKIRMNLPSLNPALKKIAAYVLENPERVMMQTISDLAGACRVSEATVTRFLRKLAYKGFSEFKIALARMHQQISPHSPNEEHFFYEGLAESDSVQAILKKIAFKNIQSLKDTQELMDPEQIERGVAAIEKARTIVVFSSGSSTVAGYSFKNRFYRLGKHCLLLNDPIEQAVTASLLDRKCLAVGISSSGKTKYVVDAMKIAKASGAATMCITDSSDSPIVEHSDIRYFTFSKHSDFLQDSLVSRMSQILVIDTLFACYALKHHDRSLADTERSAKAIERTTKAFII